jgi:MFS family permease
LNIHIFLVYRSRSRRQKSRLGGGTVFGVHIHVLKVGPQEMGFLYAAPAVGAILAGLIFPFFSHIRDKGKILIYAIIFYGINTCLFAISKNFYLSIIFIALSGSGDMISAILRNVIRQMTTPDHLRGRMTAVIVTFYTSGPQLGEIEAGFVAHLMGTPLSVAFGGIATIIATIYIAIKTPQLLNYKDRD